MLNFQGVFQLSLRSQSDPHLTYEITILNFQQWNGWDPHCGHAPKAAKVIVGVLFTFEYREAQIPS